MIRVVRLGTLLVLLALAAPVAASAEDPPFVEWTALAPGLTTDYEPSTANDCAAGRTHCVDAAVREMKRRFDPPAAACDHNAIFSLTYLRTTEEYRRTIADPAFFQDTNFVNHEDAVLARYYFSPYDDWPRGPHAAGPRDGRAACRRRGRSPSAGPISTRCPPPATSRSASMRTCNATSR